MTLTKISGCGLDRVQPRSKLLGSEAITSRLEVFAVRLEVIASRLEAVASSDFRDVSVSLRSRSDRDLKRFAHALSDGRGRETAEAAVNSALKARGDASMAEGKRTGPKILKVQITVQTYAKLMKVTKTYKID